MKKRQEKRLNDMRTCYEELLGVMEKYVDVVSSDINIDNRYYIKKVLKWLDISQTFGISVHPHNCGSDYCKLSDNEHISLYGEEHNRTISWPDDGKQPNDEWLYVISFPTGAYMFGAKYPTQTFQAMFAEIKSYGPAYCDTSNKNLYFTAENAATVCNKLDKIITKYRNMVNDELKAIKIKELETQLQKLKS